MPIILEGSAKYITSILSRTYRLAVIVTAVLLAVRNAYRVDARTQRFRKRPLPLTLLLFIRYTWLSELRFRNAGFQQPANERSRFVTLTRSEE